MRDFKPLRSHARFLDHVFQYGAMLLQCSAALQDTAILTSCQLLASLNVHRLGTKCDNNFPLASCPSTLLHSLLKEMVLLMRYASEGDLSRLAPSGSDAKFSVYQTDVSMCFLSCTWFCFDRYLTPLCNYLSSSESSNLTLESLIIASL